MSEEPNGSVELAEVPSPSLEGELSQAQPEEEDEFKERVNRILKMIEDDPAMRDRVLVEVYVTLATFQAEINRMQAELGDLGPKAFFKMLRGG